MQAAVEEFHRATDQPVGTTPQLQDTALRATLIAEEVAEAAEVLRAGAIPESAKELCDVLYVVFGSAVTFGLSLHPIPSGQPEQSPGSLDEGDYWATALEAASERTVRCIRKQEDIAAVQAALSALAALTLDIGEVCGLHLDACFLLVHASNMSKIGGPIRADGKRLKPPTYRPADLGTIFAQAAEGRAV
jgi:predicted HAD superfamily Cof-like phosphohydrolase